VVEVLFMSWFKDWNHCEKVVSAFCDKIKPKYREALEKQIRFCREIDLEDRYYLVRQALIYAAIESGIYAGEKSWNVWLQEEIKYITNMIEYYEANKYG
jgi:hypothetical protein